MLDDRSYMRPVRFRSGIPWTYLLMGTIAALFVVQSIVQVYVSSTFINTYFALSLRGLSRGGVWQLLTFQFLHGGLLHLLLNLIVIYFFGRAIEEAIGRRAMLGLYLTSGTVGGLCQMLLAAIVPAYFDGPVVGASAGALGLVAAFATLFPDRLITLLLFFVIPVSMRARTLLWLSIALAVFGILVPAGNLADGAHLGGIFAGWTWIRLHTSGIRFRLPSVWTAVRRQPTRRRQLVTTVAARQAGRSAPSTAREDELPNEEFISREVDPILDKISAHGMQSLTERERKILDAAHARMRRP